MSHLNIQVAEKLQQLILQADSKIQEQEQFLEIISERFSVIEKECQDNKSFLRMQAEATIHLAKEFESFTQKQKNETQALLDLFSKVMKDVEDLMSLHKELEDSLRELKLPFPK
ncbi:hypothetical protein BCV08_18010 [Vibrio breoganii]|nr:hypothetical protein BCV08_18010 [Vibrio breoganii]